MHRHWPECPQPVYLNTETKDWTCPDVRVQALQVQAKSTSTQRLTWSECLSAALEQIETELVLYLQEDYFICQPVKAEAINRLAEMMLAKPQIKHIGLTHFGSRGPFQPTDDPDLWQIDRNSRYRISTQAGLWRVDTLKSYLLPHENGWEFEIIGTLRARSRNEHFLTVSRNALDPASRLIDYPHTGIVKKKWNRQIPALFKEFGIEVDFAQRGFYRQPSTLMRKLETFRTLCRNPKSILRVLRYLL
jgi:hypothetical protein